MNHDLKAEGYGVRLRPVRMEDAEFIVWLRNLGHAKGRVGDSATDVPSQEKWLREYFRRPGDYYFIIETLNGVPVGAYGLYGHTGSSAESGRWIIRQDVPAAIPSAIVAFEIAFNKLKLKELRVTTIATNQPVLSLNRKFGFKQTQVEAGGQVIGGKPVDLVRFLLRAEEWAKPLEQMLPLAKLAETQVRNWEKAQPKTEAWREPKK